MASRTVDLVAIGPAPTDPYSSLAGVWSMARAAVERGDRVRVLFPRGTRGGPPPEGVVAEDVSFPLRRPGTTLEDADYASAAGRRIRPDAELVVRDPAGIGPLGVAARLAAHPHLVSFVRSIGIREFDREHDGSAASGFVDRLGVWRDRRAVRRLERAALLEPEILFCEVPGLADALVAEYGIARARLRPTTSPVPALADAPSRTAARERLGIPPDVPTVVAPIAPDAVEGPGTDLVREAFRRIRPLFPGVRLVVAGASAPSEPGVLAVPARDAGALATALAAADVALIAPRHRGFDPGIVFAQRAGCATIATGSAELPLAPGAAVRVPPSEDPGDIASSLAELVADPAACREMAVAGREYARRFDPRRCWEEIDAAIAGAP